MTGRILLRRNWLTGIIVILQTTSTLNIESPFTNNSDLTNHYYYYLIMKNNVFRNPLQIEYFQSDEIASESQGKNDNNIESTNPQSKTDEILFHEPLIEQSNISKGPYEDLIETEYLQSLGKTAFRCKEHPDKWDTDLKGLEISHFEPFHHIDTDTATGEM